MNVFQVTYEAKRHILDLHFWGCNLNCKGCYKRFYRDDLGLLDNDFIDFSKMSVIAEPDRFFSNDEVLLKTEHLDPHYTIFMGKEASLDPDMPILARAIHDRFKSTNILLTNGLTLADVNAIDEIIFSFKAFNPEIHRKYTGQTNEQILDNFKTLCAMEKQIQAEIAYIPGLVETHEIEQLAKFIAGVNDQIIFRVTSYISVPSAPWPSATRPQVESAVARAKVYLPNVDQVTSDMRDKSWKPVTIL
ncbi:radical SAM protein [Dehalogenimonas etheniformans]|uniref:Radical SAM protein n=1 Tax=Dehalogenimonas etheniformans TaxID=1536648 RepID=A0A2P5PA48_9CHLR|nr:radical SAM protein [Dehalogenimonas etheniformans]PPD59186.1 radical SAM protein [Dehalogenimonas etheniformans]QNT75771.1 radical SAM protein [Dehalogenimonas etheniformans]